MLASMSTSPSLLSQPRTAAIIGVGLLGGSVGLSLRKQWPELTVIGTSRTAATRDAAVAAGCVTSATADEHAACEAADWVFLCTPVGRIAEKAIELAPCVAETGIITDVGSTKRQIVEQIERDLVARSKFVGSHPIAGGEKTGPQHAREDLFQAKQVIVTPTAQTDSRRLAAVCQLWQLLGANVQTLSPERHDERLAGISHATHFASCAIASILRDEEIPLIGSGWRDTTRVAAGDPQMWTDIALQNALPIAARLRAIQTQLDAFIRVMESGDQETLKNLLTEAQQLRQGVPTPSAVSVADSDC